MTQQLITNADKYERAKILATVGPATDGYESILAMMKAGVNGFRLNFSHGDHAEHGRRVEWIREASKATGKQVAILQDLQGPKIRLGDFDVHEIKVTKGQELRLTFGAEYDGANVIPVQYDLSQKVKIGERIYIFDGKVRTTAIAVEPQTVVVRVENDGILMKRKGINLPDTDFGGDILTAKDIRDLEFGATQDFDYIALSFVQTADDVRQLKELLAKNNYNARVVAKIETQAAIEEDNLEEIIKESDVLMIARGDLAVETRPEVVPIIQRKIIELAQKHDKLTIVATQMLISMTDHPEPSRAEVSDVATAVIMGADCVMLSDETANGKFPIDAIATMRRIIAYAQENTPVTPLLFREENETIQDAISSAAITLAHQVKADMIICETKSGNTAFSIASHRPGVQIVSVTSAPRVAQQLALLSSNKSFLRPDGEHAGLGLAKELRQQEAIKPNSTIVLVSGRQPGQTGGTDTIRVRVME